MTQFIIHFLICNLWISGMIGILFGIKKLLRRSLTSRTQYHLWFLLFGLFLIPFLPVRFDPAFSLLSWFTDFQNGQVYHAGQTAGGTEVLFSTGTAADWMNDFAVSVSGSAPDQIGKVLFCLWILGIAAVLFGMIWSWLRFRRIQRSALPLQNQEIQKLYQSCLKEMRISRDIPVYSTAFLESPVITGLFHPCIYLPIHLISDHDHAEIRYILLHELQHYRHKDNISNYMMIAVRLLYWFNPLVHLALKALRADREIACDTSVLEMLDQSSYRDYGYTLINFAEKISLSSFPFSTGLGGNTTQIRRRILNIATYQKPSLTKTLKSLLAFSLTAALCLAVTPALSSYAMETETYRWNSSGKNISYLELPSYFGNNEKNQDHYEGTFVLYDLNQDHWQICNMDQALARTAPNSTYKIYDALFALEEQVITPEDSRLAWDHQDYAFQAWNQDQTLQTAISGSVNWYFQTLDAQLGRDTLQAYLQKIGYGNETIAGSLSSYWMESSLKISPIEQVELLTALYRNTFRFSPENIQAVKDSLCLSSSLAGTLYGKTGTGRIDGKDISGWFVGFVEQKDNTYFFATNIQADSNATGSHSAKITLSILNDLGIWK